jgi:DNA-binding MarR family transcriptional regulator
MGAKPDGKSIDTSLLEGLLGYNARRASLAVIGHFLRDMATFELRPVEFSVLTLIASNPGITARQLCQQLDVLPPNLVGLLNTLERRALIRREPHPTDKRASALHVADGAQDLVQRAQAQALKSDETALAHLSADERATLMALLKKVYAPHQL